MQVPFNSRIRRVALPAVVLRMVNPLAEYKACPESLALSSQGFCPFQLELHHISEHQNY